MDAIIISQVLTKHDNSSFDFQGRGTSIGVLDLKVESVRQGHDAFEYLNMGDR